MIVIIGKNTKIFSLPVGPHHKEGYECLVKRVCQVWSGKKNWTGCLILPDSILSIGFFSHGKEFDVIFPDGKEKSAFLTNDWNEIIELGVAGPKGLDPLYTQASHVLPKQTLFIIGSFFGIPYTLASCEVEKVLITPKVMTDERTRLLDEHSAGSPVFNHGGSLVGILEAYIESTDKCVIRALTANAAGLLKG